MATTEVTRESWFSRLGNSIKGMIAGIVLFVAGIGVTAWNEGRAVKTAKGLEEGSAAVISVESASADSANEGKLVHMSGLATTEETLRDDIFGLEAKALRLKRNVEMLQWKEKSSSKTQNKVGGGTETVTTYTYEKAWSNKVIPSDGFKEASTHVNPGVMPVESATFAAKVVTLGGFQLGGSMPGRVGKAEPLAPPAQVPPEYKVQGNTIYRSIMPTAAMPQPGVVQPGAAVPNPLSSAGGAMPAVTPAAAVPAVTTPQIGDVRITFEVVKPAEVSVVAQQRGAKLEPYRTKTGTSIELVDDGVVPAADMFAAAVAANTMMTWLLRLGGFVAMYIGMSMLMAPLGVLADVLPILGSIMRFGTSLIAVVVAVPTSLATIAIAWLAYRPVLGITLLVIGVGVPIALLIMKKGKAAAPPPSAAALLLLAGLLFSGNGFKSHAATPIGGLAVGVSSDGKFLAAAGDNRVLYILDPVTLETKQRILVNTTVVKVLFSKDNSRLLLLDTSDELLLFKTSDWSTDGAPVKAPYFTAAPMADVYACALSSPKRVEVRSLTDHKVKATIPLPDKPNSALLGLDSKGSRVAVLFAPEDDPAETKQTPPAELKRAEKNAFVHANDAKSSQFFIADATNGKVIQQGKTGYAAPYSGAFGFIDEGDFFVVKSGDDNARIKPDGSFSIFDLTSGFYGAALSNDCKVLATGSMRDGMLITVASIQPVKFKVDTIPGWPEYFQSFSFNGDGTLYGSTSAYRVTRISKDGKVEKTASVY